jgi:hypothetical protein
MATYTGFLTDNGLAELATEGEVDFAAMTPQRAVHVTLRDQRGGALELPEPTGTEENPCIVEQEDGDRFHVKVDNAIRPDLSMFPKGRLPVDTGLVIPPPVAAPLPTPAKPQRSLDRESDSVDVSGSAVTLDGPVRIMQPVSVSGTPYGVIVSTSAVRIAVANGSRKELLIVFNGSGTLYIGTSSSVTTSGQTMGIPVQAKGSYADSIPGVYIGELWAICSTSASAENVSVTDRF